MKLLMVCLGNICRSPLAQGIMEEKIAAEGLDWYVDSAGTGAWHVGEQADPRSRATARRHGMNIDQQRARKFTPADFEEFDLILVMDANNYADVQRLAKNATQLKCTRFWTSPTAKMPMYPILTGMIMVLSRSMNYSMMLVVPYWIVCTLIIRKLKLWQLIMILEKRAKY